VAHEGSNQEGSGFILPHAACLVHPELGEVAVPSWGGGCYRCVHYASVTPSLILARVSLSTSQSKLRLASEESGDHEACVMLQHSSYRAVGCYPRCQPAAASGLSQSNSTSAAITTAVGQAVPGGHRKGESWPFHSAQQLPGGPGMEGPNLCVLASRFGHEQHEVQIIWCPTRTPDRPGWASSSH